MITFCLCSVLKNLQLQVWRFLNESSLEKTASIELLVELRNFLKLAKHSLLCWFWMFSESDCVSKSLLTLICQFFISLSCFFSFIWNIFCNFFLLLMTRSSSFLVFLVPSSHCLKLSLLSNWHVFLFRISTPNLTLCLMLFIWSIKRCWCSLRSL